MGDPIFIGVALTFREFDIWWGKENICDCLHNLFIQLSLPTGTTNTAQQSVCKQCNVDVGAPSTNNFCLGFFFHLKLPSVCFGDIEIGTKMSF